MTSWENEGLKDQALCRSYDLKVVDQLSYAY